MKSQKEPIDIESVTFQQSTLLEQVIVSHGTMLCDALIRAERYDEIVVLNELTGEFTLLASAYGEQTNRIPEDLGVSLGEAAQMKLHAVQHRTGSMDWSYYVDDTRNALIKLRQKLGAAE